NDQAWSHLRLHIFPDGGVARLRAYGRPLPPEAGAEIDLAAALSGGRALAWSDDHYGGPQLMLGPGRGRDMGDGWETRRRREPGFDWIVVELGRPGRINRIEVDTAHFKGNFPDRCSLCAANLGDAGGLSVASTLASAIHWREVLSQQKLTADAIHQFTPETDLGVVSHVRLNIYPDGGVSRLRIFGTAE
ncbi:MAG: allantoicase, partial [Pseudomonadota bacterium]